MHRYGTICLVTACCPFCSPPADRLLVEHPTAFAMLDGYPVSDGHALIVPRRHVRSVFDLGVDEQAALWSLVGDVRQLLSDRHHPAGFNIGLNDGRAAGQTIDHAHIHVIPRYDGDVPDPRGGVRFVIPHRARYW